MSDPERDRVADTLWVFGLACFAFAIVGTIVVVIVAAF